MDVFVLILVLLVFLFVVFPIYVLSQLYSLRHDVDFLKEWFARTSRMTETPTIPEPVKPEPVRVAAHPVVPPTPIHRAEPPLVIATPVRAVPHVSMTHAVTPALQPSPEPAVVPPEKPAVRPEKPKEEPVPAARPRDLESLLGANWLAKLGVAAITVAVAMFLQYAFRNNWIGPVAQVAIGLFISAIMLGLGQYLLPRKGYGRYAQVLASGGIVVYFLSIYAAYAFYQPGLIGYGTAFGALAIGALAASVLALANNTEPVAVLCILGAFAAPALIRQGGEGASSPQSLLNLYAYLSVLNLWVVGLLRMRNWHSLAVAAFASTWLLFFQAGPLQGAGWITEGFAGLFLLASCYTGVRALYVLSAEEGAEAETLSATARTGLGLIIGGCAAFASASMIILNQVGALGLPDASIAAMLVALVLAGLAAALPTLSWHDREIRLLFGYLAAFALFVVTWSAFENAALTPREHIPVAFGFTLFNYLLFLAVSLILHRKPEEEGAAVALGLANVVIHALMTTHVLRTLLLWEIPAMALWLPLAGWITLFGIWIAARQRKTALLLPATLIVATLALALGGMFRMLDASGQWPVTLGASLFAGEFVLLSVTLVAMRRRIAFPQFRADLIGAFGLATIFFGMIAKTTGMTAYQGLVLLAGWAIGMAVYHAIIGGIVLRGKEEDALHRLIYLGLALTFVTLAIPLQLKASTITFAWAIEAAILIWTSNRVNDRRVRWYGMALLILAGAKALFQDVFLNSEPFPLLLNARMLAGASMIVALYVAAWCYTKCRDTLIEAERDLPQRLSLAASLFTLLFVSLELWDFVGAQWPAAEVTSVRQFALTLFWTVYAFVGVTISLWKRLPPVRMVAMWLMGVTALKALVIDLSASPASHTFLLNTRMLSGVVVIAAAYLLAWMYHRDREKMTEEESLLPPGLILAANLLSLAFLSVDLWTYAGYRWPTTAQMSAQQLALSIFWAVYALAGVSIGIWKRLRPVRLFAMGLLYVSIGKVFLFDLRGLEGIYRIVSFFTLGVILLLVSLLYTRFEERLRAEEEDEHSGKPHLPPGTNRPVLST